MGRSALAAATRRWWSAHTTSPCTVQVKKVGDFTEDRVRGLVSALDRLDSKVKANRGGEDRDALEQVGYLPMLSLVVSEDRGQPGDMQAGLVAAHTCRNKDECAELHDSHACAGGAQAGR